MPGIFLIFCIFMLHVTKLYDLFSLPVVTNPAQAATEYHNGTSYVNARLSNLYYTGVNRTGGRKIKGFYYYCLYDNNCYYMLISPSALGLDGNSQTPPATLSEFNCKAKLDSNIAEIDMLNNMVSNNLDWTSQSLNMMSSKVLINQYRMSQGREYILLALIAFVSLLAILHELIIVISLINPLYSRTVLCLSRYGNKTELYQAACDEFESSHPYAPGITLTDIFSSLTTSTIYI